MHLFTRHNEIFSRALIRFISSRSKSHYDVLNLSRSCTDKEIKEAFIRLSKKLHPDRNKNANTSDEFIRVMEAYSVLSKPQLRAQYDGRSVYTTAHTWTPSSDPAGEYGRKYGKRTVHTDYSDEYSQGTRWNEHLGRTRGFQQSGARSRSHINIVFICLAFSGIGFIIQMYLIMSSSCTAREKAMIGSKRNAELLSRVRSAAILNGNERMGSFGALEMLISSSRRMGGQVQSQMLLQKILEGSSPALATASLAETLSDNPD